MKLIESSVELLKQEPGMTGINKMIELAGRTCYKSEANITENSAEEFVKRMVNSRHMTMLEHGTIYLKIPFISNVYGKSWWGNTSDHDKIPSYTQRFNIINKAAIKVSKYYHNKYSKCHIESTYKRCSPIITKRTYVDKNKSLSYNESDDYKYNDDGIYFEHIAYITTNLRVLQENGWIDDLKYLCEPTEFHEKRIAIKFIPNIAIAREIRTHRNMSFANESTRWCNYSKGKFGNNVTFIRPIWLKTSDYNAMDDIGKTFYKSCEHCEYDYMKLLNGGLKAEDARDVLGLDVKSEIVVTGFASDWREFFDKRLFEKTGRVHPMMLKLATEAKQLLFEADLWGYIMSFPSKFN